jgi:adhesin transport system outer membrane protein
MVQKVFLKVARALLLMLVVVCPLTSSAQVLERLMALALASHPSAQSQRAQLQSAQSNLDSARWQFYPTPSVAVEQAHTASTDPSYRGDSRVASLRLQQPLYTGGRLNAGMDKAKAGLEIGQSALEEVEQQLGLRVVQAYGEWMSAHLKTQAQEKSVSTHIRLSEQVKRRISVGISADSDLVLAMARLESVHAESQASRTQGEMALARLNQLLGSPVDIANLTALLAPARELPADSQALLAQALEKSPAIQKAKAQARVQEAVILERRAELSPEVYLRLERQYGNFSLPNTSPENRLFFGLSSRFGAGLSSLTNVEAARTQHQAALADIEVQSRNVAEQVLSDQALALSSARRLQAVQAALNANADVSASYDRQFLAGRKTWIDVMNAARELTQTEMQLADLQASLVAVSWRLAIYTRGIASLIDAQSLKAP